MTIDAYGLPFEQYEDFFSSNASNLIETYVSTHKYFIDMIEEMYGKTTSYVPVDSPVFLELFNGIVYETNDECRRYQKKNNPEAMEDVRLSRSLFGDDDLLDQIKEVNQKIDDLLAVFVAIQKLPPGITGDTEE
jgi:hypothetical protein